MENRKLINMLLKNDKGTQKDIYKQYNSRLFTFFKMRIKGDINYEDLVQDVFVSFFEGVLKERLKEDVLIGPYIFGIAKRLEEIYFPGDKIPLYLDKNSETLKVIQQLRNEAHRFGIDFHRKQRSRQMVQSEFDSIAGIGPKTIEVLIHKFGSINKVKEADYEDIVAIVGTSKASILKNYFLRSTT